MNRDSNLLHTDTSNHLIPNIFMRALGGMIVFATGFVFSMAIATIIFRYPTIASFFNFTFTTHEALLISVAFGIGVGLTSATMFIIYLWGHYTLKLVREPHVSQVT